MLTNEEQQVIKDILDNLPIAKDSDTRNISMVIPECLLDRVMALHPDTKVIIIHEDQMKIVETEKPEIDTPSIMEFLAMPDSEYEAPFIPKRKHPKKRSRFTNHYSNN